MAGRIRDEDIASVRERIRIEEIVRAQVELRSAGGGSLKGLCPFHDERSPSFHVTPSRGLYYCFGCGEGGDAVDFIMKTEHITFAEAIEKLADRVGVQLRYTEGRVGTPRPQGQRTRLVEANKRAATFFQSQISSAEAETGRRFLIERGFPEETWAQFGIGYAPKSWDSLTAQLRHAGYTQEEMLTAGLVSQGNRGVYDRFRGRLIWPIRDTGGDVVGFGARKLYDDDQGPKYLNTPETPIYKKSQVLYGIDLARKEISSKRQAVVVEGYTDVMACHLAGIQTAVATCGTAFGADHAGILRRFLMDDNTFRGQVVFTFDGDAAGQKAALRAFEDDQRFVAQTFVAISPNGMDPCELRLHAGDEAVRELVEGKQPLFEFAIKSSLAHLDLNTAEGRVAGLRESASVVARIRDTALRPEYTRLLAGWLGLPIDQVAHAVGAASRQSSGKQGSGTQGSSPASARGGPNSPGPNSPGGPTSGPNSRGPDSKGHSTSRPGSATADPAGAADAPAPLPHPRDPRFLVERESLKGILQAPLAAGDWYESVDDSAYTHPAYRAVHRAVLAAGGPTGNPGGAPWISAVLAACEHDGQRAIVRELAVEPIRDDQEPNERYVRGFLAKLLDDDAARRVAEIKARMSRGGLPPDDPSVQEAFAEMLELESYRRQVRAAAEGGN